MSTDDKARWFFVKQDPCRYPAGTAAPVLGQVVGHERQEDAGTLPSAVLRIFATASLVLS